MAKHKRQHFIPSSYLEAWCDSNTPTGQTPYVWRFSKDGEHKMKKSPKKIFYETDMYTITLPDGTRDLHLEYNLSRIESEFIKIREHKLSTRKKISNLERVFLCMFVTAMYARTRAYANHQSSQWQKVLDLAERMQTAMDSATPEKREKMAKALSSPFHDSENSLSMEDVEEIVEQPLQSMLEAHITEAAPLLFKTPFLILETPDKMRFITSDDPCVWFDPANYETPRPFGAGGLVSPTLEITLPLSPTQMIMFGSGLKRTDMHIPISKSMVDNLNKRTRLFSKDFFISNSSVVRKEWF